MITQSVVSKLLVRVERGREVELLRLPVGALVVNLQPAASLRDQAFETFTQTAGQDQIPGDGLVEGLDEAWRVPGRRTATLALVEDRVVHGGRVFEGRDQRRRQVGAIYG